MAFRKNFSAGVPDPTPAPTKPGSLTVQSGKPRADGAPVITPDMHNLIPIFRNDSTLRGYPSAALAEKYGLSVEQIDTCKRLASQS